MSVHCAHALNAGMSRSFLLVKPDAFLDMGRIMQDILSAGFFLCRSRMLDFSPAHAAEFSRIGGLSESAGNAQRYVVAKVAEAGPWLQWFLF
jgi:nucleoside diphosphate kinase